MCVKIYICEDDDEEEEDDDDDYDALKYLKAMKEIFKPTTNFKHLILKLGFFCYICLY